MPESENQPGTTPNQKPVEPPVPHTEEATTSSDNVVSEKSTAVDLTESMTTSTSEESNHVNPGETEPLLTNEATVAPRASIAWQYYVGAAVVLALIVLGVLYLMDKQGRLDIALFDGIEDFSAKQNTVASVNGTTISEYDFNVSVAQISVGAQAQGADLSDLELQTQINTQAIDMLVNTELLKQEAVRRGIDISDEAVSDRLTELEGEVGGRDVLQERMSQFNIDNETLRRDISNELTIQALLNQVFEETNITVSDEEIESLYAGAGGEEAGLPPLEEVREQVVAQIRGGKEQEIVSTFIETLKETATIEILI